MWLTLYVSTTLVTDAIADLANKGQLSATNHLPRDKQSISNTALCTCIGWSVSVFAKREWLGATACVCEYEYPEASCGRSPPAPACRRFAVKGDTCSIQSVTREGELARFYMASFNSLARSSPTPTFWRHQFCSAVQKRCPGCTNCLVSLWRSMGCLR